MKALKRILLMLAMLCFVTSVVFAQKDKQDPPPKPTDQRVKIEDKKNPPPNNNGNKGSDNRGNDKPKKPDKPE